MSESLQRLNFAGAPRDPAPRYVTRPQAAECGDDFWDDGRSAAIDVLVSEEKPVKTGLLDEHGNPLYRMPPRHPVGFCR